jgi:tetratricopeptide (TPR) repeat protein
LAEGLGEILRQQGQFEAAIEIYNQMHQDAAEDNDSDTAVRTFRNLFITHNFQGEHHTALRIAQEAEKFARHQNNNRELALALAAQGWAYTYLGDMQQAVTCSKKALNLSTSAHAKREMAYCHGLIGNIALILRRYSQAQKATQKAIALFREIGDRPWRVLALHNLGQVAAQQINYDDAQKHFNQGLEMARDIGDAFGAIRHLNGLSGIAQQQGQFGQAEQYAEKALLWAEKSGNVRLKTLAAVNLSKVHLAHHEIVETAVAQKEQLNQARHWLERAKALNVNTQYLLPLVILQVELARLLLAEEKPAKALTQIQATLKLIRDENIQTQGFRAQKTCAIAWRELANIAAQMPPTSLPIYIDAKPYQVADCYQKSLEILTQFKNGVRLEIAHTLFAWAVYEIRADHHDRGETLWQQAHTIYSQLGLTNEIAKMERFVL